MGRSAPGAAIAAAAAGGSPSAPNPSRVWSGRQARPPVAADHPLRQIDHAPQQVDEQAGDRQVGPVGVGGDVDQNQPAQPLALGGDQRGAVVQPGPGPVVELQRGFREDLAPHPDVVRDLQPEERARLLERREPGGRGPGERAAQHPAAAPELDRQQGIGVAREFRAGEPDGYAAALDPARETVRLLAAEPADIGEHDDRERLGDELAQRAAGHLAERLERALQEIERAQQRLVGIRGVARDQTDRAPPPALVQQQDPARRVLVLDLQPRDGVPQPRRQGEADLAASLARREGDPLAGQHAAVLGHRANPARRALPVIGAFDRGLDAAGIAPRAPQQQRGRAAAGGEDVEAAEALQAKRELPCRRAL